MIDSNIDFSTMARGATQKSDNTSIINDSFVLNNTGNVNLNVSAYVTDANDLWITSAAPTADFQLRCNSTQTTDCKNTTYTRVQATLPLANILVNNLSSIPTQSQMAMHLNITVPSAEPAEQKGAAITFSCIDSA